MDSAVSSQSEELVLESTSRRRRSALPELPARHRLIGGHAAAVEPCVPDAKRRRCGKVGPDAAEDSQRHARVEACQLTPLLPPSAAGPPAAGGSLCCAEKHDFLEDVDCSSVEPEEGFVVYQSPLSLSPQERQQRRDGGGSSGRAEGSNAPAPAAAGPALAAGDLLQPRLVCDPDLEEMLSVLCDSELDLQLDPSYLDQHGPRFSPELYLDASMRKTAASWLVEVAAEFGLHQETLFLATALLDRFLSATKGVPRTQLQLVGVACMLIAAKHEEELHPSVLDFTNIADNCFMPGDLLRMEGIILDCLSFRVNSPTTHTFLSMYKGTLGLQPRTCALASYLMELGMLEYELLQFLPSHLASAATLLAELYMNDVQGIRHLTSLVSYSIADLQPCMLTLLSLQRQAASGDMSPYLAVRDKYRTHQWLCVANITPFEKLPSLALAGLATGAPPAGAAAAASAAKPGGGQAAAAGGSRK